MGLHRTRPEPSSVPDGTRLVRIRAKNSYFHLYFSQVVSVSYGPKCGSHSICASHLDSPKEEIRLDWG